MENNADRCGKAMLTGVVKHWCEEKGFGFIAPDTGSENIFVHRHALVSSDSLMLGDEVAFETEFDTQKGKWKAASCMVTRRPGEVSGCFSPLIGSGRGCFSGGAMQMGAPSGNSCGSLPSGRLGNISGGQPGYQGGLNASMQCNYPSGPPDYQPRGFQSSCTGSHQGGIAGDPFLGNNLPPCMGGGMPPNMSEGMSGGGMTGGCMPGAGIPGGGMHGGAMCGSMSGGMSMSDNMASGMSGGMPGVMSGNMSSGCMSGNMSGGMPCNAGGAMLGGMRGDMMPPQYSSGRGARMNDGFQKGRSNGGCLPGACAGIDDGFGPGCFDLDPGGGFVGGSTFSGACVGNCGTSCGGHMPNELACGRGKGPGSKGGKKGSGKTPPNAMSKAKGSLGGKRGSPAKGKGRGGVGRGAVAPVAGLSSYSASGGCCSAPFTLGGGSERDEIVLSIGSDVSEKDELLAQSYMLRELPLGWLQCQGPRGLFYFHSTTHSLSIVVPADLRRELAANAAASSSTAPQGGSSAARNQQSQWAQQNQLTQPPSHNKRSPDQQGATSQSKTKAYVQQAFQQLSQQQQLQQQQQDM